MENKSADPASGTSLQGKVIAITGAASGIGRATALECAARGASLALSDIALEPLDALVKELEGRGVNVTGTQVDVSDSKSVDQWVAATIEHFGKIDGAANVAGVENKGKHGGIVTDITDTTDEGWNYIININLTGLFYSLRAELRVMKAGASVVNVASIAGLMGRPGLGAYSTSKHGVVGLTRTAAKEVGKKGIRVNAVAPGPILTPMLERLMAHGDEKVDASSLTDTYKTVPLERLGKPEDVARTICFYLSDDSGWTTGTVGPIDGGLFC